MSVNGTTIISVNIIHIINILNIIIYSIAFYNYGYLLLDTIITSKNVNNYCIKNILQDSFLFKYLYVCFCMHYVMYVWVPTEARRKYWIPWNKRSR